MMFWFLFQIIATAITGWQVFNASGGSSGYATVAVIAMFVLTLMLDILWSINNKLRKILKQKNHKAEE